ncbi:MAG: zinc-binding dehydrogenase [Anaerolineaceae bacterium]|nr:zinc-binding dehydrogenase [Anaerolineaceae bacterium]
MKAVQFDRHGGADVLKVVDIDIPQLGANDVLVHNQAIGVNYVDVQHRQGGYYPVGLPLIPGIEAAGIVEAVGANVRALQAGDRVAYAGYMGGNYAEYTRVPVDKLVPVPDEITFEQAAGGLMQGLTAYVLTQQVYPVKSGDWVLVQAAAGGVGLMLVQLAKAYGATVIGTVSSASKATAARKAGADHIVLYTQEDFHASVMGLTQNEGVHVVYDAVGQTTFEQGMRSLRKRGHMVVYGQTSGSGPLMLDVNRLSGITENSFAGSLTVTWAAASHYIEDHKDLLACARAVFDLMAADRLKIQIAKQLPLNQAADAHRLLESRQVAGKVLLLP